MSEAQTDRRRFLGGMLGAAAAAGLSISGTRVSAADSASNEWIQEVKGVHRCLFDFPQHKNGFPLLHILNYLNTYSTAYKAAPGQVGAVGTFYAAGSQASIPLAFNDDIWAKYELGSYTGLKDATGNPYVRNVFNRPTAKDLHLLMHAMDAPMIPALADAMPALGIESLQKMGTKFILCANALGIWCLELEARGKGKASDIDKELRANLLPGVTIVPAMVVAIDQAQEAGIKYQPSVIIGMTSVHSARAHGRPVRSENRRGDEPAASRHERRGRLVAAIDSMALTLDIRKYVYIHLIHGRQAVEASDGRGSRVLPLDGASAGVAHADTAVRCGILGRRDPLDPVQFARRAGAGAVRAAVAAGQGAGDGPYDADAQSGAADSSGVGRRIRGARQTRAIVRAHSPR